jgi:hypothetical protein
MDGLPEARSRLEELVSVELPPELRELNATVLSTVKRVQREVDLEHRIRRQLQLRRPTRARPLPLRTSTVRRRSPHFTDVTPDAPTQPLPPIPAEDPHDDAADRPDDG